MESLKKLQSQNILTDAKSYILTNKQKQELLNSFHSLAKLNKINLEKSKESKTEQSIDSFKNLENKKTKSIDYKKGDYLIPLTVEDVRKRFWNSNTKSYNTIEYFTTQTSADRLLITKVLNSKKNGLRLITKEEYNDKEKQKEYEKKYAKFMIHNLSPEYFTPDGALIVCLDKQKIISNWLQSGKPGPYKKGQNLPFYYLSGKFNDPDYNSAQVCAGPLNVISN